MKEMDGLSLQLCGEEGCGQVPTRVGSLKTTSKDILKPGDMRLDPAQSRYTHRAKS